jgi:hypothetical protein
MVNIATSNNSLAIYNSTPEHESWRAVFQCYLEDEPLSTLPFEDKIRDCFDVAIANRIIKLAELNVEFKKWFITGHLHFRVRLKLLEAKALSAIEEVLADQDPKSAGARVNAAKYVMSLSGKTEKTVPSPTSKLEDAIAQMGEMELKALMEDNQGNETTVEIKRTKSKKIVDV